MFVIKKYWVSNDKRLYYLLQISVCPARVLFRSELRQMFVLRTKPKVVEATVIQLDDV